MGARLDRFLYGRSAPQERSLVAAPWWGVEPLIYSGAQYWVNQRLTYGVSGEGPPPPSGCWPYTSNGVGFAVVGRRVDLFSQARFKWKRFGAGPKPMAADLFSDSTLAPLDNPIGLLSWMEIDVATAGNAYVVRDGDRLRRLNPLWCTIVAGSQLEPDHPEVAWDAEPIGLMYAPPAYPDAAETFLWSEVAHYAPKPDPDARWRGMSYLSPVLAEVGNTNAYNRFITKYWENNATPNMAVVFPPETQLETVEAFKDLFLSKHRGVERAFRTAFLGGGADLKVVGANLRDLSANEVTSDAFAKICAAAGVPPVVVTIVPGLESASTYANYQTAMRAFADLTVRPLWLHAVLALRKLVRAPVGAELWYDVSQVSALQQDAMDDAQVMATQAVTIRQLTDGGWDPDSVKQAVVTGDLLKLAHTGLLSVQMQPPGQGTIDNPTPADDQGGNQ
jgi:phage portal protein BeeE